MGEVRYAMYFCSELWESYCKAKNLHNKEVKLQKDKEYYLEYGGNGEMSGNGEYGSGDEGNGFELSNKISKKKSNSSDKYEKNSKNGKNSKNEKNGKNGNKIVKTERPGGAERALNGVLNRIKNSQKPKQLAANVIRAKGLYKQISVVDKVIDSEVNTELEYALYLSTQLSNLTEEVLQNARKNEDKKKEIIDNLTKMTGVPIFCRYCKVKTQRHLDFCPTCGKVQVFY